VDALLSTAGLAAWSGGVQAKPRVVFVPDTFRLFSIAGQNRNVLMKTNGCTYFSSFRVLCTINAVYKSVRLML